MNTALLRKYRYEANHFLDVHSHSSVHVTLVVSGSIKEFSKGSCRIVKPLEFVIKPAGLPHSNQFGGHDTNTLQMEIPLNFVTKSMADLSILNWQTRCCPKLAVQFIQLFQHHKNDRSFTTPTNDSISVFLNDFSLSFSNREYITMPDWLESVSCLLEQDDYHLFSVAELASRVGVHPGTLARAHKAAFGISVSQRIQQLRIQHAAKLLWESQSTIGQVAQGSGFADQSHLNRVFKSQVRMTPGKFQRLANQLVFDSDSFEPRC